MRLVAESVRRCQTSSSGVASDLRSLFRWDKGPWTFWTPRREGGRFSGAMEGYNDFSPLLRFCLRPKEHPPRRLLLHLPQLVVTSPTGRVGRLRRATGSCNDALISPAQPAWSGGRSRPHPKGHGSCDARLAMKGVAPTRTFSLRRGRLPAARTAVGSWRANLDSSNVHVRTQLWTSQ
jgi:hypothetical protein